jgi:hypothetical protein
VNQARQCSIPPNDVCVVHRPHLSNVDIGLHNQEWVTSVRAGCFRVVEEFANFRKGGLTESSSSGPFTTIRDISNTPNGSHTHDAGSTRSQGLETQWGGTVGESVENPDVK